jgi:DNA-binding NarL/FixJ family response regulator
MLPHLRNPAWRRGPSLLALVLAGSGRSDEALDLLAEQIGLARRWGAPWVLGRLLRLSGTIRHELDPDAGVAELVEAEQVLVRSVARLEHAKALVALGRALLRSAPGERSRAVTYLLRADEIAESCSAVRLHREAVDALAEAGVQAPEQRRSGLATLTSTQRRIAVLAADGVEPRSIAEGLYLTPRAVERHLAEVRRRLGIGPDVDLAASLAAAAQAAGYALTGLHQHS